MTRGRRSLLVAVTIAAIVAIVALVLWQIDVRTRPDTIGPRLVDGLKDRHKDARVQAIGPAILEVVMSSGNRIDVRLAALFDVCRGDRSGCGSVIDRALDDVDRADALTLAPQRAALRPMVVGDSAGYRYGYVAESLLGPLEARLVLAHGFAAAFVTSSMLDRLGLSSAAANALASKQMADDRVDLVKIDGPADPALYRVRVADGDPVASLLDRARMERFAQQLGTRKVDAFVPFRGVLTLAAASDAAAKALDAQRVRMPGFDAQPIGLGVFAFDLDAPEGQTMTMVPSSR